MPKTEIKDLLKPGVSRKVEPIDYSSGFKQRELHDLKERREAVLKSKEVNWQKLSSFIIQR